MTPVPEPPPGPQPEPFGPKRQTFGEWYTHKPVAWVGTGVAGLGLLGGIIFGVSAMNASSASQTHVAEINAENKANPQYNPKGISNLCGDANGNGALPHYASACSTLQNDITQYHTDVALLATGWVFFGIGAIGTAAYAIIDWYPHRASGPTTGSHGLELPSLAFVPLVSPTVHGVGVLGTF